MSSKQTPEGFDPLKTVRKFLLSAFVACTFIAYAVHEHFTATDPASGAGALASGATTGQQAAPTDSQLEFPTPQSDQNPSDQNPASAPQPATPRVALSTPRTPPTATPRPTGLYKDGQYTGSEVDAFYGLVQVKAVVQNGKLVNVQFLEYPNDRRTSVRINSVAIPYLQREAVQAQNANVDIITGATLTSEAFMESLQAALDSAKS